ncbi:Predicted amidohydrolase [Pseudoxanthomonas sp. GM95]|uniref:carbon-nitrogen hydrolase family protein n=1 Tax=Pseudoxanthomonas sp. GM95 TaxID=1881043 RepID=UPI0008C66DD4|nr:carbon-nitrogen hydrolase family protein [Pseudoxanthomonas sp. GM95]SEM52272.1 Predicted amidohydrolase [Pseudoxanthomonas sp. GM95]
MKIAVAKYQIHRPESFESFAQRQRDLLLEAKRAGADLAVLPEYLALELAAFFPADVSADLHASFKALQPLQDAWLSLYSSLSRELGMYIQAGTFIAQTGEQRYRNRAWLFAPNGMSGYQDKLQLTGFERALRVIDPGDEVKVFDVAGVGAAIAVCYDSEFPLPVRAQREAGASLLLVPSCTDTAAGATRVRVGAMARALENRMFVAQSVTAGLAAWSPALDVNTGEAAIFAPMDYGFPDNGIVASTLGHQPWAISTVDFSLLRTSSTHSHVHVDRDWAPLARSGELKATFSRLKAPVQHLWNVQAGNAEAPIARRSRAL